MDPRQTTLRLHFSTIFPLAIFSLLVIMAGDAAAACFLPRPTNTRGVSALATPVVASRLAAAMQDGTSSSGPVVGMWRTVFTASPGTPDEFTFDEGFQQFHSDGTELMVSRGVPPDLGNVCIGVWERTAGGVIKLRHVTWNWSGQSAFGGDPFSDAFSNANTGYFELIVTMRVDSQGTRFSGTWQAVSYGTDELPVPGSEFSGSVEGERLTVNP